MDRFEAVLQEKQCHALLIRGIPSQGDDDDDEEEEEDDTSRYTAAQMNSLRYILLDEARAMAWEEMRTLVLGDQADDSYCFIFNTATSYQLYRNFYQVFFPRYKRTKAWPTKFNMLAAWTYQLQRHNFWMRDNEGEMYDMVEDLGSLWKKLLKKSDADLGIDAEYTRPGVLALLQDLAAELEKCQDCNMDYEFRYH